MDTREEVRLGLKPLLPRLWRFGLVLTRDPDGKFTGQAFVEFDTAAAAAAALGKDGSAIGERFVEVSASSREEASRNVTPP